MKRFHIAIGVADIAESVAEYSERLNADPDIWIEFEYALWRTPTLNFSIRRVPVGVGAVRHVGWEDADAGGFAAESDCNGLLWERFTPADQLSEIRRLWPKADV